MATLANLVVFLGLDSAKFSAGLDEATKKTQNFERQQARLQKQAQSNADALLGRLGSLAVGLVSIQGLLKVFEKSDQLNDLASAFSTTSGAVLQTSRALDLAGASADVVSKLWSKLAVNQDAAREGSDKLRNAFASIGVSAKEVENLNPDELFERVAQQLAGIEDPTTRNARAFELLGKSAKSIDWKTYVEEYSKVVDPDLNRALDESAKAWDNIRKGTQATFEFMVKLLEPLAQAVNWFAKLKSVSKRDAYDDAESGSGYDAAFIGTLPSLEDARIVEATQKRAADIAKKLADAKGGYKKASAEDAAVAAAKEQTGIQERQFGLEKARLSLAGDRFKLSEFDAAIAKENLDSTGRILTLEDQATKIRSKITYGNEEATKSKAVELKNIEKQIEYERLLNQDRVSNIEQERMRIASFDFGWESAYKKLIENNDRASLKAAQVFSVLESGFDQLLDTITGKSKRSFGELTISILQDLAKIALKAQAVAALKAGGGFGGIGASIGSFFGGGASAAPASFNAYDFAGFAEGGYLPPGGKGVVGEGGFPEMISTPPEGGVNITPLKGGGAGGSGVTTNYYGPVINSLNAIDTQTGLQFLIKNKEAIYAANASAQRSLPVTR